MAARVEKKCPVCGCRYQADPGRLKHGRQTTCSRRCSYVLRGRIARSYVRNPSPPPIRYRVEPYPEKPCAVCGRSIAITDAARADRTRFCSKDCFYIGRNLKATFGAKESHPGWKGGVAQRAYPREFTPRLKHTIRERDGFTCQVCGMTEAEHLERYDRVLCVNHIDFDKTNCAAANLNTLCIPCNTRIGWDRERWTRYFRARLAEEVM